MPSLYRDRDRRRLRILRKQTGMNQEELGKLAGTYQSMVSLAERGVASARTLKALARVLGVDDPQTLLDVIEPGYPSAVRSDRSSVTGKETE